MESKQVIRTYKAKHGAVLVVRYGEDWVFDLGVEYRVVYGCDDCGFNEWFDSKKDAIAYAQFLSAKY